MSESTTLDSSSESDYYIEGNKYDRKYIVLQLEDNNIKMQQFEAPKFYFPRITFGPTSRTRFYSDEIDQLNQQRANKEMVDEKLGEIRYHILENKFVLLCDIRDNLYKLRLYYKDDSHILNNLTEDACKSVYCKLNQIVQDQKINSKLWLEIKKIYV